MVADMVKQFRDIQRQLAEMLEHYETPEFRMLDERIASVFEVIYHHEPRDAAETRALVGLFLDLIGSNDAGDNIHLIERVRTLVENYVELHRPPMDIQHGAGI